MLIIKSQTILGSSSQIFLDLPSILAVICELQERVFMRWWLDFCHNTEGTLRFPRVYGRGRFPILSSFQQICYIYSSFCIDWILHFLTFKRFKLFLCVSLKTFDLEGIPQSFHLLPIRAKLLLGNKWPPITLLISSLITTSRVILWTYLKAKTGGPKAKTKL